MSVLGSCQEKVLRGCFAVHFSCRVSGDTDTEKIILVFLVSLVYATSKSKLISSAAGDLLDQFWSTLIINYFLFCQLARAN